MNTPGQIPNELPEYRLEDEQHPPLVLNSQISLVCKRIIQDQFHEIQAQTPIALAGKDIEGVHKMRVAYRRLRTCLKIYKPLIKRNVYRYFQSNTNEIGRLLGNIRDLDVINQNIETNSSFNIDSRTLEFWSQRSTPIYKEFRNDFSTLIGSYQYATFLSYLEAFAIEENNGFKSKPSLPKPAVTNQGFAAHFLQDLINTILTNTPDFEKSQPYDIYHHLRKELKQFRYAIEFFSPYLHAAPTLTLIENLISLQDQLGQLNDSVVATNFIEIHFPEVFQTSISSTEQSIKSYHAFRTDEKQLLTDSFSGIWKEFLAKSPKKLLANCIPG